MQPGLIHASDKDFLDNDASGISHVIFDKFLIDNEKTKQISSTFVTEQKSKINSKIFKNGHNKLIQEDSTKIKKVSNKSFKKDLISSDKIINVHLSENIENKEIILENINKSKNKKKLKFKEKFLDIVEVESYKVFNANMCFSDLEFVGNSDNRKNFCRDFCVIL